MHSKHISRSAREHLAKVKALDCVCCGAPGPSDAHHIEQGLHYLCLPLCKSCHTLQNGIHGTKAAWKVRKKTELSALNELVEILTIGSTGHDREGVWPPSCRD